jgi:hypothetical protein
MAQHDAVVQQQIEIHDEAERVREQLYQAIEEQKAKAPESKHVLLDKGKRKILW